MFVSIPFLAPHEKAFFCAFETIVKSTPGGAKNRLVQKVNVRIALKKGIESKEQPTFDLQKAKTKNQSTEIIGFSLFCQKFGHAVFKIYFNLVFVFVLNESNFSVDIDLTASAAG